MDDDRWLTPTGDPRCFISIYGTATLTYMVLILDSPNPRLLP